MKTLLILVDGMRPDSLTEVPQVQKMMREGTYTMKARTVMPSVTLPCHMSLFHSVDPGRHGTTTNTYMPQVRPIDGLCEVLSKSHKTCAFFFDWHELRDLTRPGSLSYAFFCRGKDFGYDESQRQCTDAAIDFLAKNRPDFAFLYMGYPDEAGHSHGWMGEEYMEAVRASWASIERVLSALDDEYTVLVTADHGGHDRTHGTEMPEDMTTPLLIKGPGIAAGKEFDGPVSIKDIAPTIVKLLGVEPDAEWEGKSLV